MTAPIGVHAGPDNALAFSHCAVIQTFVPGASSASKATSTMLFVVPPSNFHSPGSVGAVAPTYEKTLADTQPAGLRRSVVAASWMRIFTTFAVIETTSMSGETDGAGIGVG